MISLRMLLQSLLVSYVYASEMPVMVGGQRDDNNCLTGAGYSWCESSQMCIRQWETPCDDNYNDCGDCLKRQQMENIACPLECNINLPLMPPTPMPPYMPPTPIPIMFHSECPEVMCMIYCENGRTKDENNCDTCSCNDDIINPFLQSSQNKICSEFQNSVIHECNSDCHVCDIQNTIVVLDQCITNDGENPSDTLCNDSTSCPIPYNECDSEYVCQKVTEVTQCSQNGISGYTTYQLSLVIKNHQVQNIYAMYGGEHPTERPLLVPPAYQGISIFNSNLGGISPELININNDALYDSWLTIGLTNGDPDNLLSAIGIDFNSWTEEQGIETTNGAIFVMNPEMVIVSGDEYIIGQLTIPNENSVDVTVNVQGKLKCKDCILNESWNQEQIVFHLERPQPVNPNIIPPTCISWHDGCNTCSVSNGELRGCTRMMCFREDNPHCLSFSVPNGH